MSICRCMFVLEQREKVHSTGSVSSISGCIFVLESNWGVGRSNNQIQPASDSHSVCYVRTGHTIVVAMDTTCLPQLHRENSILFISNIYSESFLNPIRTWTEFQNICPNPIWPIRYRRTCPPSITDLISDYKNPYIRKKHTSFGSYAPSLPPHMYLLIRVKSYRGKTERKHTVSWFDMLLRCDTAQWFLSTPPHLYTYIHIASARQFDAGKHLMALVAERSLTLSRERVTGHRKLLGRAKLLCAAEASGSNLYLQ